MLSYEQAAALYGHDSNSRWIYCHAELGRKPETMTYIIWLSSRRADYTRESESSQQATFDEWLAQRHARLLEQDLAQKVSGRTYARV